MTLPSELTAEVPEGCTGAWRNLTKLSIPSLQISAHPTEIVIGLVSPLGTDNAKICGMIAKRLASYRYSYAEIKISEAVFAFFQPGIAFPDSKFKRAQAKINLGNKIREQTNNAILATAAAAEIRHIRSEIEGEFAKSPQTNDPGAKTRVAYIVNSLKHPDEVAELRRMYGRGFYLFGIHCDRDRRLGHLRGDGGSDQKNSMLESEALSLIERDEDEKGDHGQHTRKTFPMADFFFADENNDSKLAQSINRCLDLIFGNHFITPTFNEFAMFMAFASSLRSSDLSRQVGAVIAKGAEIISTGANDCPSPGGGLYWPQFIGDRISDAPRGRDYMRGSDSNVIERLKLVREIAEAVSESQRGQLLKELDNFLARNGGPKNSADLNGQNIRSFVSNLSDKSTKDLEDIINKTAIRAITEYGRVVHAEMEALLACARSHNSCVGATLYCTTFPCHNCAKHIIAAGIERVIYIEPYPKSKAIQFHDEAVTTSKSTDPHDNRIRFQPFIGVGPRLFFELFSLSLSSGRPIQRKNETSGMAIAWSSNNALPRMQMPVLSHRDIEKLAAEYLVKVTQEVENV